MKNLYILLICKNLKIPFLQSELNIQNFHIFHSVVGKFKIN